MKKLIIGMTLLAGSAFASNTVLEETLYYKFQAQIHSQANNKMAGLLIAGLSSFEQGLFVDALEAMTEEKSVSAFKTLREMETITFSPVEELRLSILRLKYKMAQSLPETLSNELSTLLLDSEVDVKLVYTIAAYEELLLASGAENIVELAKNHEQYADIASNQNLKASLTEDMLADLVHNTPDMADYMNGAYVKAVRLFMFCREDRLHPCLMILKDINGNLVRNDDGTLWSNPALASSKYGLPSHSRNGNTPTGVLTIDSVMPSADQQGSFGKFRRMILNFVPKSSDEEVLRSFLPESSRDKEWWKASQVARDIGRNYLRIHGTGAINKDPDSSFFPFVRTSGCVAKRENTYQGIVYKDQRVTLDAIMKAMELNPEYKNETKIKGVFYITEINNTEAPVTLEDLKNLGIE